MPYKGPPLICRSCGKSFTRPASLVRHHDERRCSGQGQSRQVAIVPARAKPRPIRAEIVDVAPAQTEIVRAARPAAPARSAQAEERIVTARPKLRAAEIAFGERPPTWWEPQADEDWRRNVWAGFPDDYRQQLLARRAGAAFSIRPPEAPDQVILWSQYHALKALATRLDAGIGGRVAESVGQRLKLLARDTQVLCVTHLPQVACFAAGQLPSSTTSTARSASSGTARSSPISWER